MQGMAGERVCGMCGQVIRDGGGTVWIGDDRIDLCHSDVGQDCYHLATVYRRPLADGRVFSPYGSS